MRTKFEDGETSDGKEQQIAPDERFVRPRKAKRAQISNPCAEDETHEKRSTEAMRQRNETIKAAAQSITKDHHQRQIKERQHRSAFSSLQ